MISAHAKDYAWVVLPYSDSHALGPLNLVLRQEGYLEGHVPVGECSSAARFRIAVTRIDSMRRDDCARVETSQLGGRFCFRREAGTYQLLFQRPPSNRWVTGPTVEIRSGETTLVDLSSLEVN